MYLGALNLRSQPLLFVPFVDFVPVRLPAIALLVFARFTVAPCRLPAFPPFFRATRRFTCAIRRSSVSGLCGILYYRMFTEETD